jgi:hypothetical protein
MRSGREDVPAGAVEADRLHVSLTAPGPPYEEGGA